MKDDTSLTLGKLLNDLKIYSQAYEKHLSELNSKELNFTKKHIEDKKNAEKKLIKEIEEERLRLREDGILQNSKAEYNVLKALEEQLNQDKLENEHKRIKELFDLEQKQNKKSTELRKKTLKAEAEYYKSIINGESPEDQAKKKKEMKKAQAQENWTKNLSQAAEKSLQNLVDTFKQGLNQINSAITSYANYQTGINARLQGTSSFHQVTKTLKEVAYSPLINSQDLYANLNNLVSQGIASNVEQKAFLQTVKSGIADTFDVNENYLKRIVRLQQTDSTAARLGMESYLTRFLNEFVQSTEYLTTTFDGVAESLFEASAMLASNSKQTASAEFEFIVQKWLGSLTGVGLSESTATAIANAIGSLGSGDIEGLSGSAINNLLVMGASKAGLSYSNLLSSGVNANQANSLLYGITTYLQELGASGNNVVKNQLAKVFGVGVTDLLAVNNLSRSELNTLRGNRMSTQEMYSELAYQMSELAGREGIAKLLENAMSNLTYQTGMNIANNPALYATWKIADLIESTTGGINIPAVSAMGNMVDLNATVTQLMKLGIVGGNMLANIGGLVNGIASIGDGSVLLDALSIDSSNALVKRGAGTTVRQKGNSVSMSNYVGNKDSDSYYNSTLNAANDAAQEELSLKQENQKNEVVKYLEELSFQDKMENIVKYLDTMVTSGITVKTTDTTAGLAI